MRWFLFGSGAALLLVTILPASRSKAWWIRVWDFPRVQIAFLLLATGVAACAFLDLARLENAVFVTCLAAALAYHVRRIHPYTPLHPKQVADAGGCDRASRLRLLVLNVKKTNRKADAVLDLVERRAPEVVLLLETDEWWEVALEPLADGYPHAVRRPLENGYGIHLFSRLALVEPQVRCLVEEDVPSVHAGIVLPSGAVLQFRGVHPVPPPHADTDERDAELVRIARLVAAAPGSAIVVGDLNDVAWSRTTRLFQRTSGLLDPRIGRGFYSTFTTRSRFVRWPVDHVFHGDDFRLLGIHTWGSVGSDHFPLEIELCHRPVAEGRAR